MAPKGLTALLTRGLGLALALTACAPTGKRCACPDESGSATTVAADAPASMIGAEPPEPTGPTEPTEPADPAEPAEPTEPTEPTAGEPQAIAQLPSYGVVEVSAEHPGTRHFDDLEVAVTPFEKATPGEANDKAPELWMRVEIWDHANAIRKSYEHQIESPGACWGNITPQVSTLWAGGSVTLIDARLECEVGMSNLRWSTDHLLIASTDATGNSREVFSGQSWGSSFEDVESEDHELAFHFEAGKLAVYVEDSAWCDVQASVAAHADLPAGCVVKDRSLKLVTRIRVEP